jgi:hypothetical protein
MSEFNYVPKVIVKVTVIVELRTDEINMSQEHGLDFNQILERVKQNVGNINIHAASGDIYVPQLYSIGCRTVRYCNFCGKVYSEDRNNSSEPTCCYDATNDFLKAKAEYHSSV